MTLIQQIRASSQIDDLDEAIRPVQELMGITDGGHADGFFGHLGDGEWAELTTSQRIELIRGYIDDELAWEF